jgi:hypothetical protein
VLLALSYDVSAGPDAQFLRGIFDADRDGHLSPSERHRVADYLARTAVHRLSLSLNGAPVALQRLSVATRGLAYATSSPASLGALALFAAPARWRLGVNRLELRDRHQDRRIPVVAALHLPPPFEIKWSSQGRWHGASRQVVQVELRAGTAWELLILAPEAIP